MPQNNGFNFAHGGVMAAGAGVAEQARNMAGMIGDVNGVIANEMARRVAIAREIRRMEHEKEMERIRQEGERRKEEERRKTDALLERLRANDKTVRFPGGSISFG